MANDISSAIQCDIDKHNISIQFICSILYVAYVEAAIYRRTRYDINPTRLHQINGIPGYHTELIVLFAFRQCAVRN